MSWTLETGMPASSDRRRPMNRFIGHDQPEYAIGLNVAVQTIAGGVVELDTGRVVRRIELPTPSDGATILEACRDIAAELATSQRVHHIGLAVPEIVDRSGAIQSCASWDWRGVDVGSTLGSVSRRRWCSPTFGQQRSPRPMSARARGSSASSTSDRRRASVPSSCATASPGRAAAARRWCSASRPSRTSPDPTGRPAMLGHDRRGGTDFAAVARLGRGRQRPALGEEIGRVVNLIDPDAVIVGGPLGLDPATDANGSRRCVGGVVPAVVTGAGRAGTVAIGRRVGGRRGRRRRRCSRRSGRAGHRRSGSPVARQGLPEACERRVLGLHDVLGAGEDAGATSATNSAKARTRSALESVLLALRST